MSNSDDPAGAAIYFITTDCMRCGVCEFMCPERAIFDAPRQAIILKRKCNGCGDCVPYCPVRAIVPRERGESVRAGVRAPEQ
ncbi:MAG: 4Fe-4S binding protein [Dehalococcoidia bacterium]